MSNSNVGNAQAIMTIDLENDELLTPQEVADKLKVSLSWVHNKRRANKIPYLQLDNVVRFSKRQVEATFQQFVVQSRMKNGNNVCFAKRGHFGK